jgi:hypothetical protein
VQFRQETATGARPRHHAGAASSPPSAKHRTATPTAQSGSPPSPRPCTSPRPSWSRLTRFCPWPRG